MRIHQIACLLVVVVCGLGGRLGWAQCSAVAPLAPLPPVVRPAPPTELLEGVQTGTQPARQAPVPTAAAPTTPRVSPQPVLLLNSRIIIVNELAAINPQDIADIHVYKDAHVPRHWQSLSENGIIDIKLKPGVKLRVKTKSLAAIRRQAKVSGLVSFELNGWHIEDKSLRVAADAIAGLEVVRSAKAETVVRIRLVAPKPVPPRHDPPGTIYIRGTASR